MATVMNLGQERAAATLYVKGWTPAEIGRKLGFDPTTVRLYLRARGFSVR